RLAAGPDALELTEARDGRDHGLGAVREHDVVGGVPGAVDLDRTGAGEPAAAAQEVDAVVREPALLPGVGVVRDHEIAPREHGLHVDLGGRGRLARGLNGLAGAQAQSDPAPPPSRRSTMATRRPPSASAPAQCSPGEPPPSTITS